MMKRLAICAVLTLLTPMAIAAEKSEMPDWMTGAWAMTNGENWADEYRTPPRAGIMIGAGRAGEGEKLKFWEHMRIVREADGKLAFWAIASDQKAVRFAAVKSTDTEIIFENAAHDYPQRIRYWRQSDMLKAEISLIDGNNARQLRLWVITAN